MTPNSDTDGQHAKSTSAESDANGASGVSGASTEDEDDRPSVLVVADFPDNGQKSRHITPLAQVADVTMVCVNPPEDVPEVTFRTWPSVGFRPLDLLLMFACALVEGVRGDYDAVASFSLFPHGCFALAVGAVCGLPTHLGIIGIDLDVHAEARYGPAVRWLMRRFTVVSVPGETFAARLRAHGVAPESVERLVNPLPASGYEPAEHDRETAYDYLWVGRFEAEKDPLLFVETMAELAETDPAFSAVMLGEGSLSSEVATAVEAHGLDDQVELAGWVDDPHEYYASSRVLLITSERDALPLTLLEGMAVGLACVAPAVGNVPDVIDHRENGVLVDDRTPGAFCDALRDLDDEALFEHVTANAPAVRDQYSPDALAADWAQVLRSMGVSVTTPSATERSVDQRTATGSSTVE